MAVALGFASPARAALLTITDTFGGSNTVWTLDVTAGCTTCTVTLTANFGGAGTNAYTNSFIDSVQWTITGAAISTINDATAGAGNVAGPTDATTTSWTAAEGSLNASQCGGGAANNVCAQSNDALGFGPIANGSTLQWTFNVTFASALPSNLTGVGGNIRAAFNTSDSTAANQTNLNIFSPTGGTFGGTGGGTGGGSGGATSSQPLVPEPTSLLLFGSGLSMAAYRARRARKQNQKKD